MESSPSEFPSELDPSFRPRFEALPWMAKLAWPAAFVAVAAMTFAYLREPRKESASEVRVDHPSATVVRDLRALARLETLSMHLEKVVEIKDHQQRLHGLVEADDALLFVAAGEVVLGVDLSKIEDGDVTVDERTGAVRVSLPPPEVLSSRFDEARSYVHARSTDVLGRRNEGLEAAARKEALAAFDAAGRDATATERARAEAERQLTSLARAWGVRELVVTWKQRSEVGIR
jgi:hypothetical protein